MATNKKGEEGRRAIQVSKVYCSPVSTLAKQIIPEIKTPTVYWPRVSLIYQGFFSIVATGQKQMIVEHSWERGAAAQLDGAAGPVHQRACREAGQLSP
jgi:hypothetical protein